MSTTFTAALANPDVGIRFYLYVGGVDRIFIDGETPIGPNNAAWSAPTSGGQSYTLQPNMLDVSDGIKDVGPEISRRTAEVSSSSMAVVLQENRGGDLLGLMAREKTSGNLANMDATFGYDVGGGPTVITVDDTSGFDSAGLVMFGRETIHHSGKTGTTFTGLTRDLFGVGAGDTKYVQNEDVPIGQGLSTVTDYVSVWHGRDVRLFAFIVGPDGRAYDTAFDGTASREIWRGTIRGNPRPMDDWQRWALRCVSIESILQTEVGRDAFKGQLVKFPGGWKANQAGYAEVDEDGNMYLGDVPVGFGAAFLLDDSTRFIDMVVVDYANLAAKEAGTGTLYDLTGDSRIAVVAATTVYTANQLQNQINDQLAAASLPSDLTLWLSGKWGFSATVDSSHYVDIVILWDVPGSIGKLLGFSGTTTVEGLTGANNFLVAGSPAAGGIMSAYISKQALTIPFYWTDNEGFQVSTGSKPNDVPAAGFARIGAKEIVEYSAITDVQGANAVGLYQLDIIQRGAMGTNRVEHEVVVGPDWTSQAEDVLVEFGVGFDGVDPLTAILQLAVSTGEAAHHSAYDALGYGVSVPLNPNHFDTDQWAHHISQLPGPMSSLQMFISKSHKLSELAATWLAPFGYYLFGGVNADGEYKIQVGQVLPPLESEADTTVGTSELDLSDPAQYQDGINRVVNQITIHYGWNVLEEKPTDDTVTINAYDSQRIYGVKGKLTWKLMGFQLDAITAIGQGTSWAADIFSRFASPYDVFRLQMDRTGWALEPGDVVSLTLPGAPTTTGTRGFTSEEAVVLQVTRTYQTPMDSLGGAGAEVLVIMEPHTRQSTYSPSARVVSKSGADVTVAANEFTEAGFDTDVTHFEANDEVQIFQAGDFSTREQKTIQSISGNVVTLNSAITLTPGTKTFMVPDDYVSAQSSQRKHVFIGDNSSPSVLTGPGNTKAFNYV